MSELRVPTRALDAHVFCADGREFRGRIFVPEMSMTHDGLMRAIELLNDKTAFFPFQPEEGGAPFLLNKREILSLTVDAAADMTSPADDEAPPTAEARLVLECEDRRIEGVLRIDMPERKSRVLDWVNRPEMFMVIQDEGRHHLVQKERITRILEVREE